MPKKHVPKNASQTLAYIQRVLAGLSPANREPVTRFIRERSGTSKPNTLRAQAVSLAKVDQHLNGASTAQATPDQLRDFLLAMSQRHATATVYGYGARIAQFLRWAAGCDRLPRETRAALARPAPHRVKSIQPITDIEFDALLNAASSSLHAYNRLKYQAMLWTLWDSGFRLGELLSLRVGSVEFDGPAGARLRLRAADEGLKTGARTIYVARCVGAIRAWLELHPSPQDRESYLFPAAQKDAHDPYWGENVSTLLNRLAKTARTRHVNAHLFRHTAATRCARSGWNESQMRAYFGWSAASTMPSVYIHLAQADMEDLVRRDAAVDPLGHAIQQDPKAALSAAVSAAVAETLRQAGLARRT